MFVYLTTLVTRISRATIHSIEAEHTHTHNLAHKNTNTKGYTREKKIEKNE